MKVDHPRVVRTEVRWVYDEGAMKWRLQLVVHADLSWEGYGVAEAQEILEAAWAVMRSDPDGAYYPPLIIGRAATPGEL